MARQNHSILLASVALVALTWCSLVSLGTVGFVPPPTQNEYSTNMQLRGAAPADWAMLVGAGAASALGMPAGAFAADASVASSVAEIVAATPSAVPPAAPIEFKPPTGSVVDFVNGFFFLCFIYINFKPKGAQASACHILVPTLTQAQDILVKLEGAKMPEFAAMAREYSTCPTSQKGGSLGTFEEGAMVPEFDKVCFDKCVPLGVPYGPVQTKFGYHIIWVEDRPGVKATV